MMRASPNRWHWANGQWRAPIRRPLLTLRATESAVKSPELNPREAAALARVLKFTNRKQGECA